MRCAPEHRPLSLHMHQGDALFDDAFVLPTSFPELRRIKVKPNRGRRFFRLQRATPR